jgi:hypothetical protein
MKKLWIKWVLWLNDYCTKHRIKKSYIGYDGSRNCKKCLSECWRDQRRIANERDAKIQRYLEEL